MTSPLTDLKKEDLTPYEGKDIKDICNTGYIAANVNHCAHFVAHALGLTHGLLCGSMKWDTRGTGASLRVNEVYNACGERGTWSSKPQGTKICLAFVTLPGNVTGSTMGNHPKKHIGICIEDAIWHYSNRNDKVVTHSPTAWHTRFKGVYGKSTEMYYGVL